MEVLEYACKELLNWKENCILVVYIVLGSRLAIMIYDYPWMLIVIFGMGWFYFFWLYFKDREWNDIGRINHIYAFYNEEESKKHFVLYRQDGNDTNTVIQHFYGSMDEKLLKSHMEKDSILAIDQDGSLIELYSCDPLICHHVNIMAKWCFGEKLKGKNAENTLCLGITKQFWVPNDKKVWRTPLVMLDMDDTEHDIYSRFRNPYENHMIGRSCTVKADLRIQNKVYHDVNICMHIFEDHAIPLYENFWMLGIYCDLKLVTDGKIAVGDDVVIKYKDRKENLLKY